MGNYKNGNGENSMRNLSKFLKSGERMGSVPPSTLLNRKYSCRKSGLDIDLYMQNLNFRKKIDYSEYKISPDEVVTRCCLSQRKAKHKKSGLSLSVWMGKLKRKKENPRRVEYTDYIIDGKETRSILSQRKHKHKKSGLNLKDFLKKCRKKKKK